MSDCNIQHLELLDFISRNEYEYLITTQEMLHMKPINVRCQAIKAAMSIIFDLPPSHTFQCLCEFKF